MKKPIKLSEHDLEIIQRLEDYVNSLNLFFDDGIEYLNARTRQKFYQRFDLDLK